MLTFLIQTNKSKWLLNKGNGMKLALHTNSLETNIPAKTKSFGVKNAAKLIGLLRNNVYTYKIGTPVQEYMSNARDAMREAKSTKRIIVTVPNQMNPVFKVRDFGPGIDPTRMDTVFIEYGGTTKDETNDQAGGFGIGSKSAWAYTDSFTVTTICGGIKYVYVMHTGSNNEGSYSLMSEEQTDEETGTEIQIAVKSGDLQEFRNAIWRACYFWRTEEYPEFKGVLAHEVPAKLESLRVGDIELMKTLPSYIRLDANYHNDHLSVVIDGIPHATSREFLKEIPEVMDLLKPIKCNVLVHVGNGVMDFPASREMISTEPINKSVLAKLAPKLKEELQKHIDSQFAKAKNYDQWIGCYQTLERVFRISDKTKAGAEKHVRAEFAKAKTNSEWIACYQRVAKEFTPKDLFKRGEYSLDGNTVHSQKFKDFDLMEVGVRGNKGFKREEVRQLDFHNLNHIFFIDNPNEFIVTQNKRIREYLEKNGIRRAILLIAREKSEMVPVPVPVPADGSKAVPISPPQFTKKILVTLKDSEKAVQKMSKDFDARALSTLSFTPTVRQPRERREKEKQEFTVHRYRGGWRKRPKQTTLEKIESSRDRYLYVPFKEFKKYESEFREMREFVEGLGYELCCLAPSAIKTVTGSKSFRSYDNWRAAYKPDAKLIASFCSKKAVNKQAMQLLSQATEKIADLALIGMLATYKEILKSNPQDVPEAIKEMISKEVKAFEKDDAELTKLLKQSYPLVSMVEGSNTAIANEIVFYINAKA